MRCRLRYKAGWTAFLFIFSIAGLILTYRQISENQGKSTRMKNFPSEFTDQHNVENMQMPPLYMLKQKSDIMKPPEDIPDNISNPDRLKRILKNLYPENWGKAKDADEMAIELKHELSELGIDSAMSCKDIDMLRVQQPVKIGSKKYVDRALIKPNNKEVVVKSQANDQETKIKCMQQVYDVEKCHVMGNYMLMREILFMSLFKNPAVVSPLGYCLRGDNIHHEMKKKGILLVVESGTPVNHNSFAFIPWFNKLQYAIRLSKLLDYLDNSPLGPVGMVNIRMDDFILVGMQKRLKLSDLDDLTFEEKRCKTTQDCHIPNALKEIKCDDGYCKGWNSKHNLYLVSTTLYNSLLTNPPGVDKNLVDELLNGILRLEFTAKEILKQLEELLKSAGHSIKEEEPQYEGQPQGHGQGHVADVKLVDQQVIQSKEDLRREEEIRNNKVLRDVPQGGEQVPRASFTGDYIRHNQSNFPGLYDYVCPKSRVVWGCVMTVQNLKEAKEQCNNDFQCKSFVLFTSNPDAEALMTMVAKNLGTGHPEPNAGATLFIKSSEVNPGGIPVAMVTKAPVERETEVECRARTQSITADARTSREKRLMAHLGLKGTSEDLWKLHVKTSKIERCDGFNTLMMSNTKGGRFDVQMDKAINNLKSAIYLAEFGVRQYHIAYLITYHLDRLLGLYHIPPTVTWFLRTADVADVEGDKSWPEQLGTYLANGDDIKGLLTVAAPRVIKQSTVSLEKRNSMVKTVLPFTRMEKLQLEYVLLWFLVKIPKDIDHLGYKGHLIHFHADEAFQDLNVDLLGYFSHCQFPNVVYKSLSCHKCRGSTGQHSSSVCSLGQTVIQQVVSAGYNNKDIRIQSLTPTEITSVINDAASDVLSVIDACIKKHGREKVLY
ncbi:hypothetical protein FSP39_010200 [Pinctada imbricata]|uniref:FAM69 protein-kinase domain-containing protein n=1 Tax=Pinctada imbricata TaxID=66713 RepID=A0AA89BJ56_PINIB|nr:hypothetical protein FSP39_010200 [Pinctada imbricata]